MDYSNRCTRAKVSIPIVRNTIFHNKSTAINPQSVSRSAKVAKCWTALARPYGSVFNLTINSFPPPSTWQSSKQNKHAHVTPPQFVALAFVFGQPIKKRLFPMPLCSVSESQAEILINIVHSVQYGAGNPQTLPMCDSIPQVYFDNIILHFW